MELTKDQIVDRIEAFTMHAGRIQELKDELLEIKMVGTGKELEEREARINEIMQEVKVIYHNHMLVIMRELMDFVTTHHEEIAEILRQYEGENYYALVEELLLNVQRERDEREAQHDGFTTIESFPI